MTCFPVSRYSEVCISCKRATAGMVGSVLWDHGIPADSRWYDPVDDPFTQTNKVGCQIKVCPSGCLWNSAWLRDVSVLAHDEHNRPFSATQPFWHGNTGVIIYIMTLFHLNGSGPWCYCGPLLVFLLLFLMEHECCCWWAVDKSFTIKKQCVCDVEAIACSKKVICYAFLLLWCHLVGITKTTAIYPEINSYKEIILEKSKKKSIKLKKTMHTQYWVSFF